MNKLEELLNSINATVAEVRALAETGKLDEAKAKKAELEKMQEQFDLLNSLEGTAPENVTPVSNNDSIHAFAEAARNRFRNVDTKNSEGVNDDGGYTVPEDIQTRINRWKEAEFTLRNLVSTENVSTLTGARTYLKKSDHTGFETVAEAGKIKGRTGPKFERIEYKIEKRGGFLAVTNELLADSDANISNFLIEWLGKASVATDNENILKLITEGENFTKKENVDDLDTIKEIINVTLGQIYAPNTTIVTNDDGLQWFDTLKDQNGRYLLSADTNSASPFERRVAVGGRMIPLVVIPNAILKTGPEKGFPMIIGDLKEAIRIYDRQQISIMTSNTAAIGEFNAFEQDMTLFRATLRNDYKPLDKSAIVYATHSPKD